MGKDYYDEDDAREMLETMFYYCEDEDDLQEAIGDYMNSL